MRLFTGIGLLFLMTSFFTTKDLNDVIKKEVLHQIEQTPISQFIDSTDKFNYSYLVKKWEAKQRMGFLNSINKETLNGSFILYEEIRFTQPQCFSSANLIIKKDNLVVVKTKVNVRF